MRQKRIKTREKKERKFSRALCPVCTIHRASLSLWASHSGAQRRAKKRKPIKKRRCPKCASRCWMVWFKTVCAGMFGSSETSKCKRKWKPFEWQITKKWKKKIKEFQKANAQPVFWIQFGVPVSCSVQIFG